AVVDDGAQDNASGDADEQELTAIVTDPAAAARRRTQAVGAPVNRRVVVAVIVRKPIAAAPRAIAWLVIAVIGLRRRTVIPAALIRVAVVAAAIPALISPEVTPVAV